MKYTCKTIIFLPKSKVVKLWADENNFKEWQDGFLKIVHIHGEPAASGSQSKIFLEQGNQKMELLETVISNNLPDEKSASYEHIHMTNTLTTRFRSIDENTTEYIAEVEYIKFNGIIPELMSLVFPGMFRKQNQKWLDQFKKFAESESNSTS